MIISRTPMRDLFLWRRNRLPVPGIASTAAAVLATTIDKYCYITCRYLPPFFEHRSLSSSIPRSSIVGCLTRSSTRRFARVVRYIDAEYAGVEIHHDARPAGAKRNGLELGLHGRPSPCAVRSDRRACPRSINWPLKASRSSRTILKESGRVAGPGSSRRTADSNHVAFQAER